MTKCEAKTAVGGGVKAKRRGEVVSKQFCFRCGISGWFSNSLSDVCEKTNAGKETDQ